VANLNAAGYRIFAASDNGEDYGFLLDDRGGTATART
jgi:hypothetical protein